MDSYRLLFICLCMNAAVADFEAFEHYYRRSTSLKLPFNDDGTPKATSTDPCVSPVVLSTPAGVIDFPGGSRNYGNWKNCAWLIYGRSPESKIRIQFEFINIEQDRPCDDYVQLFTFSYTASSDGSHTLDEVTPRVCPSSLSQLGQTSYLVDSPAVYIKFHSDWIYTARGFILAYTVEPKQVVPSPVVPTRPSGPVVPATPASGAATDAELNKLKCNFESATLCGWSNDAANGVNFKVQLGASSMWSNWIKTDHTLGTGSGSYLYLYTNGASAGARGVIKSPLLNPSSQERCLTFWYNMLQTTESLLVKINDGSERLVFNRDGSQNRAWHKAVVPLQSSKPYYIQISHARGEYSVESGVAIDDIDISFSPCSRSSKPCGTAEVGLGRRDTDWVPVPGMEGVLQMPNFSSDDHHLSIIGGSPAKQGQWTFIVYFRLFPNGILTGSYLQCGATLITPEWLVTAAHCFETENGMVTEPGKVLLTFGEVNRKEDEESEFTMSPKMVIVHSDRNNKAPGLRKRQYDIALIKLKAPLVLDNYVNVVCMPTGRFPAGTACYATGWGLDESNQVSSQLQYLPEVLQTSSQCSFGIADGMLCSIGAGISDVCAGDSGGPLVCVRNNQYEFVGAVSFGDACSNKQRTSGVYTDIHHYLTWINKTITANE